MNIQVMELNGHHIEIGKAPSLWYDGSEIQNHYWVAIDDDLADQLNSRRNDRDNDSFSGPFATIEDARSYVAAVLEDEDEA